MKRLLALAVAAAIVYPSHARVSPGAIDVLHYDVEVRPDFAQGTISGKTTIRLQRLDTALTEVSFSPNAMAIDAARMNDSALRVARGQDSFAVELARPLRRGQMAEITLRYSGKAARGLTFERRAVYSTYSSCMSPAGLRRKL
jgi:aminopeptidase N